MAKAKKTKAVDKNRFQQVVLRETDRATVHLGVYELRLFVYKDQLKMEIPNGMDIDLKHEGLTRQPIITFRK